MNPKFDGPSFVNPSNTSFNLDNGKNYQTPKINANSNLEEKNGEYGKKEIGKTKGKPRGGWEDDDKTETKPKSSVKRNPNATSEKSLPHVQFVIPNKIENKVDSNSTNSTNNLPNVTGYNAYVNYWDAETSRKIQSSTMSVEYETKIIDDILLPTGITVKPTDSQINEFLKRLKSLDKKIVGKILYDKISNYEQSNNQTHVKMLTKCLFVIISILNEKIEDLCQFFNELQDIFTIIHQFYLNTSSKKVAELSKEILSMLNGEKKPSKNELITSAGNSNHYSQNKKMTIEDTNSNSNSDKNSSLSGENKDYKESKAKFSFIKKKANNETEGDHKLEIENLTSTDNKIENMNELFGNLNMTQSVNASEGKHVTPTNTSKFSFIKSKAVVNPNTTVNPSYPGVSQEKVSPTNLNDELNKAFSTTSQHYSQEMNKNLFDVNTMNNLYGNYPIEKDLDIANIPNTNKNHNLNNKKSYPANIEMLFDSEFMNESSLADMQSNLNDNSQNSKNHFDFVNDMLKPNKFR